MYSLMGGTENILRTHQVLHDKACIYECTEIQILAGLYFRALSLYRQYRQNYPPNISIYSTVELRWLEH